MNPRITPKKYLLLPLLATLIAWTLPQAVQAQGGSGSKGGVVLACFVSDPAKFMPETDRSKALQAEYENACKTDPNSRMCKAGRPARIYTWPSVTEDPNDERVGYANNAIVWDAVNKLKYVQLAEYYLATTYRSWSGTEDQFGNGTYHLHPLLYLINDLPVNKKVVPEPKFLVGKGADGLPTPFNQARLKAPYTLTPDEAFAAFDYVKGEEARLRTDRDQNTPVFSSIYNLVSNMFRGVPGFYMRLRAAHEKLGLIPNNAANMSGSDSDQWDSRNLSALTSLPKQPENCLWMTAADRIGDNIIYDRYLWSRMDLFQRVLLQLHEEIYYMASDAKNLQIAHRDVEGTRFFLSHFLRGERSSTKNDRAGDDRAGDFVSYCASYDTSVSSRTPGVKLLESSSCMIANGPDNPRTPLKGADLNFLPAAKSGQDAVNFVSQFVCASEFGCPPGLMAIWEKLARYYGPYSSTGLQGLLATENDPDHDLYFGGFSTIDRLVDMRDKSSAIVTALLAPYEVVYRYCDNGGYLVQKEFSGPQPPKNNPRRLEKSEREQWERKEENVNYIPKQDEPVVKKSDLEEIAYESRVYKELRIARNLDLQILSQGLHLQSDFPDRQLTDQIATLLLQKTPVSFKLPDLEPGKNGKHWTDIEEVCNDVDKRQKDFRTFLKATGTADRPLMSFYEQPEVNALDQRVPKPAPQELKIPR